MKRIVAVTVGTVVLVVAATALAAKVDIPDEEDALNLVAQDQTTFDSMQPPDYNSDCALGDIPDPGDDLGYSPAGDVDSADSSEDVFDGGLVLWIQRGNQRHAFEDGNAKAVKRGNDYLRTGPDDVAGLRVTRVEEGLGAAPALRSLIKLQNRTGHTAKRTIIWDSDLGADDTEVARASSAGGTGLSDQDSWLVFADNADGPSDGVGTFVLFGKGAREKTSVFNEIKDQDSCVSFKMRIAVPPNSTRYLLFFTEAHDNAEEGVAAARKDAKRYNDREPKKVLRGLSDSVRSKVLNWDLR